MTVKLVILAGAILFLAGCNKNVSQSIDTTGGPSNASATDNDVIAAPATPPAKGHQK